MLSADVQNGIANSDRLARTVNFNNANYGVTATGNFDRSCGQLSPRGGGDSSAVGYFRQSCCISCELVVALCAFYNCGNDDGALTGCGSSGVNYEVLQNCLRAMVVDCVSLFIEDEAVVDDTTFDEPAGDAGRIIVTICYPIGSLSDSSYSFL